MNTEMTVDRDILAGDMLCSGADLYKSFPGCSPGRRGYKGQKPPIEDNDQCYADLK